MNIQDYRKCAKKKSLRKKDASKKGRPWGGRNFTEEAAGCTSRQPKRVGSQKHNREGGNLSSDTIFQLEYYTI